MRTITDRTEVRTGMQRPRVAVGAATYSQTLSNPFQVKPPTPSGGLGVIISILCVICKLREHTLLRICINTSEIFFEKIAHMRIRSVDLHTEWHYDREFPRKCVYGMRCPVRSDVSVGHILPAFR